MTIRMLPGYSDMPRDLPTSSKKLQLAVIVFFNFFEGLCNQAAIGAL